MGLFPKDRDLSVAPDRLELRVRASDFRQRRDALEMRLDAFLRHHLTWRSRTSVQRLIRDGFVSVACPSPERATTPEPARERRVGRLLRDGARVVVEIPPELRIQAADEGAAELSVLYEDEECLALDKPAGLAVHPGGRYLAGTLIQRVHERYRRPAASGEAAAAPPIRLCHRLDRETSGVCLLGKGERAHRELIGQFERREVRKEYLALVHGEPREDAGRIDWDLRPAATGSVRLKMAVTASGLPSVTEWCVLRRAGTVSLLSCRPLTGRQHQIRVHLEALGHPLVGDKLYGVDEGVFLRAARGEATEDDEQRLVLPRHALHSHRLAFRSVRGGEPREVISPLPADLAALLEDPPTRHRGS